MGCSLPDLRDTEQYDGRSCPEVCPATDKQNDDIVNCGDSVSTRRIALPITLSLWSSRTST